MAAAGMAPATAQTMSENAKAAARMIALEQQKRPGRKVRVVATAEGFDGFKYREVGERFIAFWPDDLKPPSWQMEEKEYKEQRRAAAQAELEADEIGE